jgi:hypothetical protein
VLPHILSVLTHLFNFVFNSCSCYWSGEFSSYYSILPVLSKGIVRILCDQFAENVESCGFSSRFQSGFRLTSIMDNIH